MKTQDYVRRLDQVGSGDISIVGGKNASLGEMIQNLKRERIRVPGGFATTAAAYREFISSNNLTDKIGHQIKEYQKKRKTLHAAGRTIREMVLRARFPDAMERAVRSAYAALCATSRAGDVSVAVRSSATAEDLPQASFAGQQETFLNVRGAGAVLEATRKCCASLFTDRAIAYREEQGFDHMKIALSVGIQKMVRSDLAGSGVMFSIDTDTGFRDVAVISAAWGLGENVVQGAVNPDEYVVFKPLLGHKDIRPILDKRLGEKEKKMVYGGGGGRTTRNVITTSRERNAFVLNDNEILTLAGWASVIEAHYGKPMDMEWAKDGKTGELFIVQARPETVQSQRKIGIFKTYALNKKGKRILKGMAVGQAIAAGSAQVIRSVAEIGKFKAGNILVTEMTDPDWVPIMKIAAGIVTDHGGRTSHAAIVSRELGVPAIVGAERATREIKNGRDITISCAEGESGYVYDGRLGYHESTVNLGNLPRTKTRIMINIATPEAAFRWWQLPCRGIGLARMEFIINNIIKIHPMALVEFDRVRDAKTRKTILALTEGYRDKSQYFVDRLAGGIAKIAASQYPEPVIVRMSDFKSNEYANLIGGQYFEAQESNPMLGFRGASRYYNEKYRKGFDLECRAVQQAREKIGLSNIVVMIPFCRTLEEADSVLKVLAENGLKRGRRGLEVYVMCEIPSNVILASEFSDRFDGFSIGSNDLTQLVLGISRDSVELSGLFNEGNAAVKEMIRQVIAKAHAKKRKVGFCGQAPSDKPGFAEFLVRSGIDSISLNPDSVVDVIRRVAKIESRKN